MCDACEKPGLTVAEALALHPDDVGAERDAERSSSTLWGTEEKGWANLADIVGQDGHAERRVADFGINGDEVMIGEACDGWFAIGLNSEQVDKLIAWLQDAKLKITTTPSAPQL